MWTKRCHFIFAMGFVIDSLQWWLQNLLHVRHVLRKVPSHDRLSYIHSVEPPPNRKLAFDPVTISQTSTVADPPIITLMLEAEQGVVVPHLLQ